MPGWASRAKQCAEALTQAAALAARRSSHSAASTSSPAAAAWHAATTASVRGGGAAVQGSTAEQLRVFSSTSAALAQALAHADISSYDEERFRRELLMLEVRAGQCTPLVQRFLNSTVPVRGAHVHFGACGRSQNSVLA